ncbi:HAD family hydrolase [Tropicimonas marinistellae]|uniref:HAD family hydrolase n=1 Tax=Tropicimonas marinistellae TaxID=1739787 RepID=UPI00098F0496|nr:HAD family phosphatase [Tropicimonas marinistellae]
MPPVQAILFDLDGCLVDSEPLSLAALAAEIRAAGLAEVTFEDMRDRYLGVSMPLVCEEVSQRLGRPCPPDFRENYVRRLFAAYDETLPRIEDMVEVLDRFQDEGLATCIVSGGGLSRIRHTLDRAGLSARFGPRIYSGEEVPCGKPAPDLVLHAAAELGVEPRSCVVIEDSPHGIVGAIAAGMRAIGFTGGQHLEGIRDQHAKVLRDAGAEFVSEQASELFFAARPFDRAAGQN